MKEALPIPSLERSRVPANWKALLLHLLALASIYAVMLLRWGYEFGRNDQMQTLAYAKMLANPDLYPLDAYLRGIHANLPNERYFFSWLLSPFAGNLPLVSILGHALFALIFLHFLWKISARFIDHEPMRWLVPLLLFVPLYGVNLGGNELYYNSFFVSNVVKTIGLAGLWFFITNRYFAAFGLFAIGTFFQPVVGIQLFATATSVLFAGLIFQWLDANWRTWIIVNIVWLMTAGVWVIFLRSHFEGAGPLAEDHFFEILYVFRSPHHYLPSSWTQNSWLIEGAIILYGLYWFSRRDPAVFLWIASGITGCLVYLLGMELLRIDAFGAVQWFKITIWLEALGVIAISGTIASPLYRLWSNKTISNLSYIGLYTVGSLATILFWAAPAQIPMEIPLDHKESSRRNDAVLMAEQIKALTPQDALLVHPINYTELKVYGDRSSWADYKILIHTREAMHTWHDKMGLLYGISWERKSPPGERYQQANQFYRELDIDAIVGLKAHGVTHFLTFADANPEGLQELARTEDFALFRIP